MVRKNQAKALDSMQCALETEAKGKAEALRMKRSLKLMLLTFPLHWSMPLLAMLRLKTQLRSISCKSEMPKSRSMKNLQLNLPLLMLRSLEHAIAGNAETQNTIKKYQLQVRDA